MINFIFYQKSEKITKTLSIWQFSYDYTVRKRDKILKLINTTFYCTKAALYFLIAEEENAFWKYCLLHKALYIIKFHNICHVMSNTHKLLTYTTEFIANGNCFKQYTSANNWESRTALARTQSESVRAERLLQ